ncbi:MAG: hypothetical protein J6R08_06805 [Opitutales bacterium]|nr:hypothetical protein [Opitutales bacterium]
MEKEEKKEVKKEEVIAPNGEEKEQSEVKDEVTKTEKTNGSDDKAGEKTDAEVKTDAAPQPGEKAEAPQEPEVQVEEMGNGIPIEQVALKDDVKAMIEEALAPFKAKYAALEKENEDLKTALADAKKDAEETHAKYEKGDFGAPARKGEGFGGTKTGGNESYVSYNDMWAGKKNFD